MAKKFKKVGQNLFCSDFAMQEAVSHTHQFLSQLDREVNFEELWREKLLQAYKGGAELS
jgi:hypothetical protein